MTQSPTRHKIFEARQAREEAQRLLRRKMGISEASVPGGLSLRIHNFHLRGDHDHFQAFSNAPCAIDSALDYAKGIVDGWGGPKRAWTITNTITGESVSSESGREQLRGFQAPKEN